MPRSKRQSWLDDTTELPIIDKQVEKLDHFTQALADGMVDNDELHAQEKRVAAAMKAVEKALDDDQHALVTELLVELAAYDVMHVLHDLAEARVRKSFG